MDSNICSGNTLSLISDNLHQFAILNGSTPDYKNTSYIAYDYRNFDAPKFRADYDNLESSFLDDPNSGLDKKFDTFLLNLHLLGEKHCAKRKLSKKALKLRSKHG